MNQPSPTGSPQLSAAGIDIGADTEPGTIQGVRWLLLEALSNLVNNAIAHTPAGGTITVRCGADFLEVSDSGIGIPVDEREQVLGRFFRGSNARGAGSGLGLAIVAEVAQLHGASVVHRLRPRWQRNHRAHDFPADRPVS